MTIESGSVAAMIDAAYRDGFALALARMEQIANAEHDRVLAERLRRLIDSLRRQGPQPRWEDGG